MSIYKAITIRQPWAGLIAVGEKIYETRSWPTKYRGPIAIHAGKSSPLRVPITPGLEEYANHNEKLGSWLWLPCGDRRDRRARELLVHSLPPGHRRRHRQEHRRRS